MARYIGVFEMDIEAKTETDAEEKAFDYAMKQGLRFQFVELDEYQGK